MKLFRLALVAILSMVLSCAKPERSNGGVSPQGAPGSGGQPTNSSGFGEDFDGTDRGNGSEDEQAYDFATWFADSAREVNYCVVVSDDFGRDGKALTALVSESIELWVSYISERKEQFGDASLPSLNFKNLSECDGSEDVKFAFGIHDGQISQDAAQFKRPWAYSAPGPYDLKARWRKGYVWFAKQGEFGTSKLGHQHPVPDWSTDYKLESVITHEIGHLLGVSHIPGTVMAGNLAQELSWQKGTKVTIDRNFELFLRPKYIGQLGGPELESENFQRLSGRALKDEAKVYITLDVQTFDKLVLHLEDSAGSFEFPLTPVADSEVLGCSSSGSIFKVALKEDLSGAFKFSCEVRSVLLKTQSGESLTLQLSRNMDDDVFPAERSFESETPDSRINLRFIDGEHSKVLFYSIH